MDQSTPRRAFGPIALSPDDDNEASPDTSRSSRLRSFQNSLRLPQNRIRFPGLWRRSNATPGTPASQAPIPTAFESKDEGGEPMSTPLPTLPMIVLSITMLGEFLCANVSTPFMLFMVKGFGESRDEADAAFWTGILVASFFLTQFLTSLLWATIANKHGVRIVLTTSLLGGSLTCLAFGTSTSLKQAMCIRLLQGIFAGAVGVGRGSVTTVTDPSNEGRAYAILGFCWGLGGIVGAIVGGTFESPAEKWPGIGVKIPLFVTYPYILPCAIAAFITFIGAVLSLFVARDGGPRSGAIRLIEKNDNGTMIEEEEEGELDTNANTASPGPLNHLRKKVSGYFGLASSQSDGRISSPLSPGPSVPLANAALPSFRRPSRADGSAYGYSGNFRSRLSSAATGRFSMRHRHAADNVSVSVADTQDLNFAQRLLMANENAVSNIADLWVAAAINVDASNDNPFLSDSEEEGESSVFDQMMAGVEQDSDDEDLVHPVHNLGGRRSARPSVASNNRLSLPQATSSRRGSNARSPQRQHRLSDVEGVSPAMRRISTSVPAIFNHVGVRTPPAVLDAQLHEVQYQMRSTEGTPANENVLAPIAEGQPFTPFASSTEEVVVERPPSLMSQLPLMIILQYGILALHSTTNDQLFMSYLVTPYESGGLNLKASHFAQLIALMCFAQIIYQFFLYPNLGPPRGRFSHLAMFRLGSFLFIPSYLTVILYRVFASSSENENFLLMTMLAISTAIRYAGVTFAYTAVAILLNYMTPPSSIGIANGIAQSIVSLARCIGPVLGGVLWSVSIQDHPSGYYLGFLVVSAVCGLAVLQSLFIR